MKATNCLDGRRLLSTKEVAAYVNLSTKTIFRAIAAGVLKCQRRNRFAALRFRLSDVEKWISGGVSAGS